MDFESFFRQEIEGLCREGRYRVFAELERQRGRFPEALIHRAGESGRVTIWCSNDYVGIGQHPAVIEAMHEAIDRYGSGSGGTRNISGTNVEHVALERELAEWHGKEAALLFTSGYVANWAALGTLAARIPGCVVFSDADNHASMIEGIRHSRAEKHIFAHNDPEDLDRCLTRIDPSRPKLVAFESVYSMGGDVAPIDELCTVAKRHRAMIYLDEVHAVGLYGKQGAGIAEQYCVENSVTVIEGTLGKALGMVGGYIAGSSALCDFVRSFASGFIFTTSLPPVIVAGARASLRQIRKAGDLRLAHQERVAAVRSALDGAGIPHMPNGSHIVPVMVGDAVLCRQISDILLERYAIYIQPINYPTVPKGSERLRITPGPMHSDADIRHLIGALSAIWGDLGLRQAA